MPRKELTESTRDYTIHLAKRVHKIAFKKRAPRAIREITKFAVKEMRTDVRIHNFFIRVLLNHNTPFLITLTLNTIPNDSIGYQN